MNVVTMIKKQTKPTKNKKTQKKTATKFTTKAAKLIKKKKTSTDVTKTKNRQMKTKRVIIEPTTDVQSTTSIFESESNLSSKTSFSKTEQKPIINQLKSGGQLVAFGFFLFLIFLI